MRLVLWDIDGTLVHTAGHGRDAFAEAFLAVFDREASIDELNMAGRTDHMIAMAVLEGGGVSDGETHMERMFEELAGALEARRERI
ncbi:MAG: HAD family hydrolase, partial [Actinomycetota bacterium]|nr:HAD family hydrolase [Actinomycetota bacterium]